MLPIHLSNHDSLGHPGSVYVTKMAIRKHSNTFTLNQFPSLLKRFVRIFHDYYVDSYSIISSQNAQGFVSATL